MSDQYTPVRLEIALALVNVETPEAKELLKALMDTDPAVAKVLKVYGVEEGAKREP